jgi:hypothetical protein
MLMPRVPADARISLLQDSRLALQQLDKALVAVNQGPGEVLPFVCLAGLVE